MVSVPQFTMGGQIRDDWMQGAEGVSNALGQYYQRGLQNRKIEQDQRQFEAQNLLARNQFGELQRQHGVTNALARDKFGLEQAKSPYEMRLLQAQAEAQRAHGGYYDAQAGAARSLINVRDRAPAAADPASGLGMRENGTIYRLGSRPTPSSGGAVEGASGADGADGAEGGVSYDQANGEIDVGVGRFGARGLTGGVSYDQANGGIDVGVGRFGARGLTASDVPGVVVNGRGGSDRFATERARGQALMESHPDAQRMQKFMETQEVFTRIIGKPRTGFMYNEQGYEVPKGPPTSAAAAAEQKEKGIKFAKSELEEAQKTLLASNAFSRAAAAGLKDMGPPGRLINNAMGLEDNAEAFGKVKGAVLQTVYALSGKQTTNREMDNFLDQFMPLAGESAGLIKSKMKRLNTFLTTLESNTRRGMAYDDAERAAMLGSGGGAGPAAAPAAAQPEASPGVKKYGNKYQGLE
jgi:hypothetical protein